MSAQIIEYLYPGISCPDQYYYDDSGLHWFMSVPAPTQAEIDAAILPAKRAQTIEQINAEAKRRIEADYPQWRQLDAALGILPDEYVEQMRTDISAIIAASNTACDLVDAAQTIEAVDAVEVLWP